MHDLGKRLAVSAVVISLVSLLLIYALHPIVKGIVVIAVACFAAIGSWEMNLLMRKKGMRGNEIIIPILSACFVLLYFLSREFKEVSYLPFFLFFFTVFVLFVSHFPRIENALPEIASGFFSICYVAIPLALLLGILYSIQGQDGRMWLFYTLAVTKAADIGGYFIGNAIGKRPLAKSISPKKTWEGAIGGFAVAVLVSYAFFYFSKANPGFSLTGVEALVLGALLGSIGQIGDLSESLLKRDAVVKDSNRLPGLGGILDLFDSLLFTLPAVFLFLYLP